MTTPTPETVAELERALRDRAAVEDSMRHRTAAATLREAADTLAALVAERDALARRVELPEGLVISAVRYALGRATYVVYETASWLREHWHTLSPGTRQVILRDVLDALVTDRAGMDCDRQQWETNLAPNASPDRSETR
jgi:hypothetical protein